MSRKVCEARCRSTSLITFTLPALSAAPWQIWVAYREELLQRAG
jgi:hypothetical protein